MRILAQTNIFLVFFITIFSVSFSFSQSSKTTIEEDPRFEKLLSDKRSLTSTVDFDSNYKIQIYYGDKDNAKGYLNSFKKTYKEIDARLFYTNPMYKVWVGNFKSRIDGERALSEIRNKFPGALLIKPNRD